MSGSRLCGDVMTSAKGEVGGAPVGRPGSPARTRDRYLDVLRAVALVRVVVYHTFGFAWIGFLFPSMGVMFALAGSLVARSLDRTTGARVVHNRVRRLLPSLWLLGVVLIPAMLPALRRLVTVLNTRALAIYLWHNIAIDLAVPIDDRFGLYMLFEQFGTAMLLVFVAVLAFGWAEDIAARRRPQLIPGGQRQRRDDQHCGGDARADRRGVARAPARD